MACLWPWHTLTNAALQKYLYLRRLLAHHPSATAGDPVRLAIPSFVVIFYGRQLTRAVEQTEDELLGSPRMRSTGGALRAREGRSQGAGSPPSPVPGAQALSFV